MLTGNSSIGIEGGSRLPVSNAETSCTGGLIVRWDRRWLKSSN